LYIYLDSSPNPQATEESLLVLRGLGIQTTTSSSTYLSTQQTRFIPTTSIQDIFIHEAFKGFEVRFYLAIVVEGEHDVVVVFPVSLFYFILSFTCSLFGNAADCGKT
jgi:phosphatidylinositol glycan class H protein